MNNLESYPPVLRHLSHHQHSNQNQTSNDLDTQQDLNLDDQIHDPAPVPVIDLQCLLDQQEKKKLDEACKDWGLFRLVNHGVPLTLLKQLQDQAKELFSMSFETKNAACSDIPVTYFWGTPALTPSGTALTRGPQNINWVEGFDVPLGRLAEFQPQLPTLESIRLLLMDYETHLSRIATTLFKAMVEILELNLKPSKAYLLENTGMVRVYRYPHCSHTDAVGWGMEVHTDSSVLSILNQDDQVSGLEVLRDGRWLTVKPISNTLIVNLGDMMQAISNDVYKSALHRVKVNKYKERISICYFVFPGEDVVVESSNYKPFTYNEFRAQVQQDVKTIGYKVGLARFKQNEGC